MTALVGVLNKRGAAIAADSAVTVFGNGSSKIYNNEQKIFPLSDKNPIGVMICNNLNFLTTPWALIFELYKAERGNQTFPKLTGYVEDFIKYLKSIKRLQTQEVKNVFYQNEFEQLADSFRSIFEKKYDEVTESNPEITNEEVFRICYEQSFKELKEIISDYEINPRLKDFSIKDFYKEVYEPSKEYFSRKREEFPRITEEEWNNLLDFFHRDLINNSFSGPQQSELIFVGFGSEDIFPASQRIYVLGMTGTQLKYNIEDISEISHTSSAEIRPFAQTDVMITLMKGVSPQSDQEYRDATIELEEGVIGDITALLEKEKVSPNIIKKIKDLTYEKIHERYIERIDNFIHENFISGVVTALDFFNLEEMAKMAENLIAVTNLQRHISSSEESVGGPIEVAIITKTAGFRWIKHFNLT
ncbi:MAG: hypothetical protein J1F67_06025 [Muribaculaceae bacterium]|nr:hypothetical protein [Muribaculaceae bacterium]